jgi:hypothetical protein
MPDSAKGDFTALAPNAIHNAAMQSWTDVPVQATGRYGVPTSGVSAVAVEVVTDQIVNHGGEVLVRAWGSARTESDLSVAAEVGQVNSAIDVVPVSVDGKIALLTMYAEGRVRVFLRGFYSTETGPQGATFVPVVPDQIGAVTATGVSQVQVAGRFQVPAAGVSAVAVQVVVDQVSTAGAVQLYPGGTRPVNGDMTVHAAAGEITNQYDISRVSADGKVFVYSAGAARVRLFVRGYYSTSPGTAQDTRFVPLPPRVYSLTIPANTIVNVSTKTLPGIQPRYTSALAVKIQPYTRSNSYVQVFVGQRPANGDISEVLRLNRQNTSFDTWRLQDFKGLGQAGTADLSVYSPVATTIWWTLRGYFHTSSPSTCSFAGGRDAAEACFGDGGAMNGLFGTWANQPIPVNPAGGSSATQYMYGGSRANRSKRLFLVYATAVENGTQIHKNYWYEADESTYKLYQLGTVNPDRRWRHYMALRQCADCAEWDIYLDYNHVGATTMGFGEIAAQAVGYQASGAGAASEVSFTSRPQFQNPEGIWLKWGPEVKTVIGFPCGDAYRGTTCMNATYPEPSVWTVTEPGPPAAPAGLRPAPVPAASVPVAGVQTPSRAGTAAGVDQVALQWCLTAGNRGGCLEEVPGLRACARARLVCNTAHARTTREPTRAMTAHDARSAAARLLSELTGRPGPTTGPATVTRGRTATVIGRHPTGPRDAGKTGRDAWVVDVPSGGARLRLPGLDRIVAARYRFRFDVLTHELLELCGGPGCR